MKKAIDAIREKDANRFIIADGRENGNKPTAMIRELGVAQSMRGYYPSIVSHYLAGWVEGAMDFPSPRWPCGVLNIHGVMENDASGRDCLWENYYKRWEDYIVSNDVMVGEWGAHNKTPHEIVLSWMEDTLKLYKEFNLGWALWNFIGSFGIIDSGRTDVKYENINGYMVDRKMLELLQKY